MTGKFDKKKINEETYMKIREEAWLKDWEDWSKKVWPEYYEEKDNDEQLHRQKIY